MNQKDLKKVSESVKQIYDNGCYFLSLLYVSSTPYSEPANLDEILTYYDTFVEIGWMDPDCYVKDPCAILKYLTGKKYSVKKDVVLDTRADIVMGRWYNPTTNLHHFVVMNKHNSVVWDPLGNSITVRDGIVESYRLFRRCN